MSKDPEYRRLIQSRRWRNLRNQTLRKSPYCENCKERGLLKGATEVHHVVPVEPALGMAAKEALMFDPNNLRCLCRDCHMNVHREMRVHSKETVKQRQKERLEAVLNRFFPGIKFEEQRPGG